MTKLELAIGHLKETISVGNVLLTKLEIQQVVAEELSPHKWEHGDIFETSRGIPMIYLKFIYGRPQTVCIVGICGGLVEQQFFNNVLQDAKFLFNIKEKL